jgi:hypothetical protein
MALQRFENYVCILLAIACLAASSFVPPPGYQGQVSFNGFAVPGATVTATQDAKKFVAVTDDQGVFTFPEITNGTWTIEVVMSGFAPMKDQVVVGPNMPVAPPWELKMLPLDEMKAETAAPVVVAAAPVLRKNPVRQGIRPRIAMRIKDLRFSGDAWHPAAPCESFKPFSASFLCSSNSSGTLSATLY